MLTKNFTVEEREHAWDVTSNIIFVDSPVNVGYSYSDDPRDRVFDEQTVAADLLDFLEEFFLGALHALQGDIASSSLVKVASLQGTSTILTTFGCGLDKNFTPTLSRPWRPTYWRSLCPAIPWAFRTAQRNPASAIVGMDTSTCITA